ncbi:MAG: hypothetical protein PSV16_14645 [Flavobacterium sp.]|nr:hypothetical protein [Flavobacterium sp.]
MTKEVFTERKSELVNLINHYLNFDEINWQYKNDLKILLEILTQYSYENKLQMKGTLTHTIIDSLQLDYTLGEKFIQFDKDLN